MTKWQIEHIRQNRRLRHRHNGRRGTQQRANRQINVAHDNYENHARRHDRDRCGLD